jgi:hypothetical protein
VKNVMWSFGRRRLKCSQCHDAAAKLPIATVPRSVKDPIRTF